MLQFNSPIPCVIKKTGEDCYAIYCESSGMFDNDVITICKCNGGQILHVLSCDLLMFANATFGIKKEESK